MLLFSYICRRSPIRSGMTGKRSGMAGKRSGMTGRRMYI